MQCDPSSVAFYLALALPTATLGHEYARSRNHYLETYWRDLPGEVPVTGITTKVEMWVPCDIVNCNQSIIDHGRPTPPRW
eukprot:7393425-Alexandrium_andersonii.AAC.1